MSPAFFPPKKYRKLIQMTNPIEAEINIGMKASCAVSSPELIERIKRTGKHANKIGWMINDLFFLKVLLLLFSMKLSLEKYYFYDMQDRLVNFPLISHNIIF